MMYKKALMMALVTILISLGSCAKVRYQPTPLPLPARPVLPQVSATELQCLSDKAYKRLVLRQLLLRQYSESLESIIQTTHQAQ